jgi:hypothetical protein
MADYGARGKDLRQGEVVTLFPAAVYVTAAAAATGTPVYLGGERLRYLWVLTLTNAGDNVADTLDVFIDFSLDGTTYVNAVHFTQILGNGADALTFYASSVPTGTTTTPALTADAAVGTCRPALIGPYVRGRYALVNGGGTHTFTFSLVGYAQ